MADIRDQFGNPIQLTDELGNLVQLTNEHDNPRHLTGIATSADLRIGDGVATVIDTSLTPDALHTGVVASTLGAIVMDATTTEIYGTEVARSSEDDGHGGRRKKKRLNEKIKEKLTGGGKHAHSDVDMDKDGSGSAPGFSH
ncbi:late embryogenesis abundant protein-like [Diospyros lotus]|uniref:late embryogenesis abundant protein-like n=1 Tax=Diospyros lotus TaxID=55363 RepID=UPI002256BB35|nr:late embryogenesis abundant protein-like [Diospyros lotus]